MKLMIWVRIFGRVFIVLPALLAACLLIVVGKAVAGFTADLLNFMYP